MQNVKIYHIKRYRLLILIVLGILSVSPFLLMGILEKNITEITFFSMLILFYIGSLIFSYNRYYFIFDYEKEEIRNRWFKKNKFKIIKMKDISYIKLKLAKVNRKEKKDYPIQEYFYNSIPYYVVNKGKIYYISINLKNGRRYNIIYNGLYDCFDDNKTKEFEDYINQTINEFTKFKRKKYIK